VIRIDQIVELFQGVYQAGRWPISIYPGWLRILLTFLVPVAFAVTVPAESLTGRLSAETLFFAFLLTVFLMVLARAFWKFGLRFYSGASA
jgi:ABC-2 type transport system permease protein